MEKLNLFFVFSLLYIYNIFILELSFNRNNLFLYNFDMGYVMLIQLKLIKQNKERIAG